MPTIRHFLFTLLGLIIAFPGAMVAAAQQSPTSGGVPVRLLVTVEPTNGSNNPAINQNEVMVYQGQDRDTVTDWTAAQGESGAMELYILIDDESSTSLGSQLGDLRHFIEAQPPSTEVGVAYMQNGIARVAQQPTSDHAQAAKALRLPMAYSGANSSPYFSLSNLVKKWPATEARREVLMISDGIDRYYGAGDLEDPYLQTAIDDAGKAGISVSAIYTPGAGHYGHSYWLSYWGQLYLSELANRTGGEAYYIGFTGAPVSFAPYLDDLSHRMEHQYWLGFLAKPGKKAGWQSIRLATEVPHIDLVSAGRVWVPVGQ